MTYSNKHTEEQPSGAAEISSEEGAAPPAGVSVPPQQPQSPPGWGQPGYGQPQTPPGWQQPPLPPIQPGWGQPPQYGQQPQYDPAANGQTPGGHPGWGQPQQNGQPGWGQPQSPPVQPVWGPQPPDGQPGWGPPPQGQPYVYGQTPQGQPYYVAPDMTGASRLEKQRSKGGIGGAIAGALLLLLKYGGIALGLLGKLKFLAIFGKLLLTSGSMLLSMWAYASFYGWPFGIGMVLQIFIHECGHALAARLRGVPTSFMIFIPFMGAAVFTRGHGKSLEQDAFIGIMGPVVGTSAAAVLAGIGLATGNPFWLSLAQWGFFVNLFNLIPTAPLDGGWIVPLFSPKALAFGAVLMIGIGFLNPFIWVLGLLSLPRIIGGWKADPTTQPYYQVAQAVRVKYGLAYVGLAAFLGGAWWVTHSYLQSLAHFPVM